MAIASTTLAGCSFTVLAPPPAIDLAPVQVDDSGRTSVEFVGGVGSAIFGPSGGGGGLRIGYGVDDQLAVQIRGAFLQADLDSGAFVNGHPMGRDLNVASVGVGARWATAPRPLRLTAGLALDHEWSNTDLTAIALTGELGLAYHWKYVSPFLASRFVHVRPSDRAKVEWYDDDQFALGPSEPRKVTMVSKPLTPTSWLGGNAGLAFHPGSAWDLWFAAGMLRGDSETDNEGGLTLGAGLKIDW